MTTTEFPDWATPGAKVLSTQHRFGERSVREGTITRLTATRIVVDFGANEPIQFVSSKHNRNKWEEYGRKGSWYIAAELVSAESSEGKKAYQELAVRLVLSQARTACDRFQSNRTAEQAKETITALQAFIKTQEPTA